MSTFLYEARSRSGEFFAGTVEAADKREAAGLIRRRGLWIASLNLKEGEGAKEEEQQHSPQHIFAGLCQSIAGSAVGTKQRVVFIRQLAVLLQAGLPVHEALQTLMRAETRPHHKRVLQDMLAGLMAGQPFYEVLQKQPHLFPASLCAFVQAGEKSGALTEIFMRLADFEEHRYKSREALKSSLMYPVSLLLASLLAIVLMGVFVLPTFAVLLRDLQAELPWTTRLLLAGLACLQEYGWQLLGIFLLLTLALAVLFKKRQSRAVLDDILLALPFFGTLQQYAHWRLIFELLSLMLTNGLPLLQALKMVEPVPENLALQKDLHHVRRQVEQGQTFVGSLQQTRCPVLLTELLAAGEAVGTLDLMLGKAAAFADEAVRQRSARLEAMAEPLMIFLVGGLVFFFVLSVMLPLLTTMDALM